MNTPRKTPRPGTPRRVVNPLYRPVSVPKGGLFVVRCAVSARLRHASQRKTMPVTREDLQGRRLSAPHPPLAFPERSGSALHSVSGLEAGDICLAALANLYKPASAGTGLRLVHSQQVKGPPERRLFLFARSRRMRGVRAGDRISAAPRAAPGPPAAYGSSAQSRAAGAAVASASWRPCRSAGASAPACSRAS